MGDIGKSTDTVNSSASAKAKHAIWTHQEELTLVQFLAERRAEAGDGMSFPKKTWERAAEEMRQYPTAGGPKTWSVCKNKWGRVSWLPSIFPRAALLTLLFPVEGRF
jgi:nucleoid-associated protein YejK